MFTPNHFRCVHPRMICVRASYLQQCGVIRFVITSARFIALPRVVPLKNFDGFP